MDHSEDDHVDQPALTDDELDTAPETPAVAAAEELAEEESEAQAEAAEEEREEERALSESLVSPDPEDEPVSSADDLSARAGGPDLAEDVDAVVEEEVVNEEEEATLESEEPDVAGATGAADPGTEADAIAENDEQPVGESEDVIDLEDAEPAEATESGDTPVEVEPELAAAVEEAFEGTDVLEEGEPEPEFLPGDWYVVHTYAGYENKVKADLETRVASMNMEEQIYEVVIPMEDVVEVKGGKKQTVQRKVFPGYLLVRMELSDDSWYVVRNTPGVTGFVGSGTKPIPLSEREVDKILKRKGEAEKPRPKAEWQTNDPVRVTTGPFANFQGVISEVDDERQKVKVLVNIFGRETPVELSYDQISKV